MSIVEVAPTEIRGLLGSWFLISMGMSLFVSTFCVYGVYSHVPVGRLQYQAVFFAPCIFMLLLIITSFFACESPRWLLLVGRRDEGIKALVKLRGLPADHPRVDLELKNIEDDINKSWGGSHEDGPPKFLDIVRETFTIPSNLRRLMVVLFSYGLAQLSGANSITSYFVPILTIMGLGGDTKRSIFLSGMYGLSKLFFSIMTSFFFIDMLGRRKSLLIGITIQMISDVYVGVYVKYSQEGSTNTASTEAALAALFIHAFGYSIGKSRILTMLLLLTNQKDSSPSHTSSARNSGLTASVHSAAPWAPCFTGYSSMP
jgi:MFS family permease